MMGDKQKDDNWIRKRVEELTERQWLVAPQVISDTTHYMSIDRDQLIELEGKLYLVRGNAKESRFGLQDQPKFWVKTALALADGKKVVLKLVFHEEFSIQIGTLNIKCKRSEEKESQVLNAVRGDPRFMQGTKALDEKGNLIRILDFIYGEDLLSHVVCLEKSHIDYFHENFPLILARTRTCLSGLQALHDQGLCHGDVRNDHILIEKDSKQFRWIDFDLTQEYSDFDLWSVGNILQVIAGKGLVTYHRVVKEQPKLNGSFSADEASVFFPHRLMNLTKIYPFVPQKYTEILMRFSQGTKVFYDRVDQVLEDLGELMNVMGWPLE